MSVTVDVLALQPADLDQTLPPWEVGVPSGHLGVAVIDGSARDWSALASASDRGSEELRAAPVITVGVARGDGLSPAGGELLDACDLVLAQPPEGGHDLDERLRGLLGLIKGSGSPALVAAQLMRAHPAGITAESLAYSVLLFSEEFSVWRERHRRSAEEEEAAPRVQLDSVDGIWTLALTRPAKHNAFDARMREELCDALDAIASTTAAPVVLSGAGASFCSGGDLDEFGTADSPMTAHLVRNGRSVARRLQRLRPHLVAAVHGHCVGSGVEFAAFATHVLAAPTSTFALPELTLGLNLGAGGSVSIPGRIGRHRTLELLMRSSSIDAETALRWGLVDELVEPERLRARALEVAEAMA